MQLDRLDAVLRPRSAWETIDLGMQMARAHFMRLWLLWWLSALPVSLLMTLLLHDHPEFIASAVWWFKPAFEPILVLWLGRALFGDRLSLRETARQWWPATRHRLVANLLWRRFSTRRSLFMPITVLERAGAAQWSRRARLFGRNFPGGFWLTVAGVHFETVLMIGVVAGGVLLLPAELLPDWEAADWFTGSGGALDWVLMLASLLAMSLVAPFYVAGGFALYLSRRTDLEAWDIELSFRRFARALPTLRPAVLPALLIVGALGVAVPGDAMADIPRDQAGEWIGEILADPVFGGTEERTDWVLDFDDGQAAANNAPAAWNLEAFADLLRLLLWLAVAVFMTWLTLAGLRYVDGLRRDARKPRAEPEADTAQVTAIAGTEPLPEDVPSAVRAHLERGEPRRAVALLYRASLDVLVRRHGVELAASATEAECLRQVRARRPGAEARDFAALTTAWIDVAYAGVPVDGPRVLRLLDAWGEHYAAGQGRQ